jgi:TPR repeat protein
LYIMPPSSSAVPDPATMPQSIMPPVKVLFFAADPLSVDGGHVRLQLDREAREIEREVVAALHRDSVEFETRWATRLEDLRRELLRVRPQSGLVLQGTDPKNAHRVDAEALKEFFSAFRGQIGVVVLNACHSRPQAEAIAEAVGCAIGTPAAIQDEAAIAFSAAFYSSIAYGQSVQAAFDQACATLRMGGFAGEADPQLVVRPGLDASKLVLVSGAGAGPRRSTRRTAALAAVAFTAVALFTVARELRGDPACAPARQVLREVREGGATPRLSLLSPPGGAAGPNNPLAGPPELVEARRLHREGNHAADLPLFRQAAEAGNTEAMTTLGLKFLHGQGVAAQEDSAIKWLREAAERDDPRGMTELANAYLRRQGVDRNSDYHAKNWYEKAAALGYAEAIRNLGNLYREGRGVTANAETALVLYEMAARAGFVDAMVDAGFLYDEGMGVPASEKIAMCWYSAAAEAGSVRGKVIMGEVDENAKPGDELAD